MMSDTSAAQHYCVVFVTASSEAEATAIAQALVREKLAACISLTPIKSIYRWQDRIHAEPEWQLAIKTTQHRFEALQSRVLELHSYEVPEILAIPIQAGSAMYLNWMSANVEA
ncbi:divalent-cation tolerance protein CutA [Altericista sp. CCNU0014]|uniref:divalent-cation tolerance protein CutA n=1 Tax=Altericista sp. CCNU0014 TaxID=3082949 RepID=UPI00384BD31B